MRQERLDIVALHFLPYDEVCVEDQGWTGGQLSTNGRKEKDEDSFGKLSGDEKRVKSISLCGEELVACESCTSFLCMRVISVTRSDDDACVPFTV